uniref:Prokineticin 1 n=1 Tax=Cyprinus carpio TaxID=7962 RepID=A0A8C1PYJ9_CYPCA
LIDQFLISFFLLINGDLIDHLFMDVQCGVGLCCAVSLWLRGLRMCTPQGLEGDECHPYSHKVPFPGKRQHHTCPCLPHLGCTRYSDNRYRCTSDFKNIDF